MMTEMRPESLADLDRGAIPLIRSFWTRTPPSWLARFPTTETTVSANAAPAQDAEAPSDVR